MVRCIVIISHNVTAEITCTINVMCLSHPKTIPPARSMKKLPSTKSIPGVKKIGDRCPKPRDKVMTNPSADSGNVRVCSLAVFLRSPLFRKEEGCQSNPKWFPWLVPEGGNGLPWGNRCGRFLLASTLFLFWGGPVPPNARPARRDSSVTVPINS